MVARGKVTWEDLVSAGLAKEASHLGGATPTAFAEAFRSLRSNGD
jgi:hypothetical protein